MISEPCYSDAFIGRRDELAFLEEEFRAACEARVRFVSVEGEPGIGKSRLLSEFCKAVEREATVAIGACSQQVRAPYLPFTGILQTLDRRAELLQPRDHAKQPEEKFSYFAAVAETLRRHGARKPLVVAIEDAQWADDATVELLCFLLTRLRSCRCFIVVTMRTGALEANSQTAMLRSTASRMRAKSIRLRPMHRHEIRRLVHQSLERRGAAIEHVTLAKIESLAEGNPLFAEELTRNAVENGELTFQTDAPLSLEALLGDRLGTFSHSEPETLYRAAVVGQTFDARLVAAIANVPLESVLQIMQRAAQCGLVREHGDAPGCFSFRHALIRQVLADRLVLALAAPLHVRIAEALEAEVGAEGRAAELAYHWTAARVPDKARRWNEAAGHAAWNVFAYRDAIRFYMQALQWEYPRGTARAAIYERIGTLLYIDGCGDDPASWFARARAEYETAGNAVGAAHARLLEADQMWVDARTQESAVACAEATVSLRRLGHAPLRAQALLSVARYAITLGNVEGARANLSAAQRLCTHFDAGSRASWHEVSGETHAVQGDRVRAMAAFRSAARLVAESGVSELIAQVENNFALAAVDLGDLDRAVARHQIAVDEAQRTGMMWRVAYSSLNYARTLMLKGKLARARDLVREALDTGVTTATFKTKAASVGIPLALMLNDGVLLSACADEHAQTLARQSGEPQRIATVAAAFAALRVAQGSLPEARRVISSALHALDRVHRCWELLVAAAMWGDEEDVDFARALFSSAQGRPIVKRAYRLLFDALVLRAADDSRSPRAAKLAHDEFSRMGNVLYATLSLEAGGRRADARRAYEAMGAVADVERLSRTVIGETPSPLTPRQTEIGELVCGGLTNREIATQLHISEHTVEHHLSSIFERLGIHSRAQLAHVMALQRSK